MPFPCDQKNLRFRQTPAGIAVASCKHLYMQTSKPVAPSGSGESGAEIRGMSPAELEQGLLQNPPITLVDVREYVEFVSGHIASSKLLPLRDVGRLSAQMDHGSPIVCVCQSGKRSAEATTILRDLGFENVAHLEGGVAAWKQSGRTLVSDARAPWSLERQVRFSLGLFILAGLGLSFVWPPAIAMAWVIGVGMVVTAIVDWCGMALLLARAPWNQAPKQG